MPTRRFVAHVISLAILVAVALAPSVALTQQEEVTIEDNSFLVEEAFNQEQGIVQHIFNWVPGWDDDGGRQRTFNFVFTQEWPLGSQRHQFSYTLPMQYFFEQPDGQLPFEGQGFGDMLLNYRLQVWDGSEPLPAFAPRFSLILPTGDERDGLGNGQLGYQVNLPFSKQLKTWAFHFNAGWTRIPNVRAGVDPLLHFSALDQDGYNLGASAIYFLRPSFHLMLEWLVLWGEELTPLGEADQTFQAILNPGFRWAPYTEGDTQWVIGAGVPIGLNEEATDFSLFLYMSFEHRIQKQRK